jgi:hypothetical protein
VSLIEHPRVPEFPTSLSGIKGSIDSVTMELRHGSSSIVTIFVELSVEGTFFGLKIVQISILAI